MSDEIYSRLYKNNHITKRTTKVTRLIVIILTIPSTIFIFSFKKNEYKVGPIGWRKCRLKRKRVFVFRFRATDWTDLMMIFEHHCSRIHFSGRRTDGRTDSGRGVY